MIIVGGLSCIGCGKDDGYWEEEWNQYDATYDSVWVDTTDPEKQARCRRAPLLLLGGILVTLLPEGVSYHIPIVPDHVRLSPYVNLAAVDWIKTPDQAGVNLVWSYGGGCRIVISDAGNFMNLSGYAEWRGNSVEPIKGYYGLKLGFRVN